MRTGPRAEGRSPRVLVALFAAVTLVTSLAGPAFANEEQTEFDQLRSRFAWTAWADSRPVSPFFGIPFEFTFGTPFARSFLDSTPGRAEAFAAYYYGDDTIEETYENSGYKNHTLARSNFPDIGRGTENAIEPAGPNGPRSWVKTPNRTEANAEVRDGPGTEALAAGGWGKTKAMFNREDRILAETSGAAQGVQLPGGASVGLVESMVKVEHNVGVDPLISYRISLAGVRAGDQELVGIGDQAITLMGTRVAGRDVADQFNAQAKEHGGALEKVAAKLSLHLVEPRINKEDNGAYSVAGPVFEIRSDNTPRKNQAGDNVGLRLGYVRTFTWLVDVTAQSDNAADEGTPATATSGTPGAGPEAGTTAGVEPARIEPRRATGRPASHGQVLVGTANAERRTEAQRASKLLGPLVPSTS